MKNIMLDLETFGCGYNALIVAIGACEFDPDTAGIGRTIQLQIDPEDALDYGLKPDMSTLLWWMKQSDAARAQFDTKAMPLTEALNAFQAFVQYDADGVDRSKDVKIWGNGSTFDNVVITSAFRAIGSKPCWSFRNDCCYRTLKGLLPDVEFPAQPTGVAHHAVDDALNQAIHANRLFAALRGAK